MPETPTRFRCRHVFSDGRHCGCPALRDESFCFHHHTARRRAAQRPSPDASLFELPPPLVFPPLEDRAAIQSSLTEVLNRLAELSLDPRRAGLLLYGLQIASSNLPRQKESAAPKPADFVDAIITDPELGPIAPIAELPLEPAEEETPSVAAELLRQWRMGFDDEGNLPTPSPTPPTPPPLVPHSSQPYRDEWDHPTPPTPTPLVPHSSQPYRDEWYRPTAPTPTPLVPHSSQPYRDEWDRPPEPTPTPQVPHSSQPYRDEWDRSTAPTPTPQVPHSSQPYRDEWDRPAAPTPTPLVPHSSQPYRDEWDRPTPPTPTPLVPHSSQPYRDEWDRPTQPTPELWNPGPQAADPLRTLPAPFSPPNLTHME